MIKRGRMGTQPDDCSKAFETILYYSGKFGSYQRRVYMSLCGMHVVCSAILTYVNVIPTFTLIRECQTILARPGNESGFGTGNNSVMDQTTCRSYYDNDEGLEEDWVFPPVRIRTCVLCYEFFVFCTLFCIL